MGIVQDAIDDAAEFTANSDDFGVEIILTAPNDETVTVNGYSRKHHLKLSANDQVVNAQNASVTISEKNILAINPNYPVRISDPDNEFYQEVMMRDHIVEVADSSGVLKKYKVSENYSDETLGLIVLILEYYEEE